MAITPICSSSATQTPSISLSSMPTIPSFKTHQQQQLLQHLPSPNPSSSPPCKFGSVLISNDALTLAAATEAVTLAIAAAQAAREAVTLACALGEGWISGGERGRSVCGVLERRESRGRKRRRRKKEFERLEMEGKGNGEMEKFLIGSVKPGSLSTREEAEFCISLREGEKLEAARRRVEDEPTSKHLAKDIGMNKRSIDKILCRRREARERITRSYRRLVVSIATGYQGKGLSLQDLIQEGSIGLLRGAEKFDPEKGYKLSTYVYWWIKQAIIRAIANKSRVVRLPGSMSETVAKIAEANNVLSRRLRRRPTCNEIAEMLNLQVSTVRLIFERSRSPVSLDQAVTDQGHMTLQEILQGPEETTPEHVVKRQQMKQEIQKLLQTLSNRESEILRLHFGVNGEAPQSCEEIGRLLKLSRERIRQIKCIALIKLRQTSNVDDLKVYIV